MSLSTLLVTISTQYLENDLSNFHEPYISITGKLLLSKGSMQSERTIQTACLKFVTLSLLLSAYDLFI